MTTAAELTPHRWDAAERTLARVAQLCALEGNYTRMRQYMQQLHDTSPAAYDDFLYALAVMHPIAREVAGIKPMAPYPPGVRHESIKVPCGRCGHDERNEEGIAEYSNATGLILSWTKCPQCPDGICQPVKVPAHVEGWPIAGRTTVDAEEIVE